MDDEIVLVERTVTCRTAGCGNENISLTFLVCDLVMCGACGAQITDIQDPDL